MAEIRIEKKKPIWPWILAGLVLLGLLALFLLMNGDDDKEEMAAPAEQEQVEGREEQRTAGQQEEGDLALYTAHVSGEDGRMGLDHEYTHRGLTLLAKAISQVSEEQGFENSADIASLKEKGDQIKKDPMSLKHANRIQEAFEAAVNAISNLQQAHFPEMQSEVEELRQTSQNLNPDAPTLEQRQNVKGFFDQSADILRQMDRSNNS